MKNLTQRLNENIKRVMSLKEGEGSVPMVYNFIAKVTGNASSVQKAIAGTIEGNSCKIIANDSTSDGANSIVKGRFQSSYPLEGFLAKAKIIELLGSVSGVSEIEIEKLEMVY